MTDLESKLNVSWMKFLNMMSGTAKKNFCGLHEHKESKSVIFRCTYVRECRLLDRSRETRYALLELAAFDCVGDLNVPEPQKRDNHPSDMVFVVISQPMLVERRI